MSTIVPFKRAQTHTTERIELQRCGWVGVNGRYCGPGES